MKHLLIITSISLISCQLKESKEIESLQRQKDSAHSIVTGLESQVKDMESKQINK